MKLIVGVLVAASAMLAGASVAAAQSDPRVRDFVQAGVVRVAVFPPQYGKETVSQALRGWPVDLANAFASHLGIKALVVEYPGPREVLKDIKDGACDFAFLPYDPSWAETVDYSFAFLRLDFTLLVPAGSSIRSVADADKAGVRIAVVNKHASTLALGRIMKQATLASMDSPDAAFELLRLGQADAMASVRPALLAFSDRLSGAVVLEDRYGANTLSIAFAKGHAERLSYFNEFIEQAKASGLVQRAIDDAAWRGARVAPPGNSD